MGQGLVRADVDDAGVVDGSVGACVPVDVRRDREVDVRRDRDRDLGLRDGLSPAGESALHPAEEPVVDARVQEDLDAWWVFFQGELDAERAARVARVRAALEGVPGERTATALAAAVSFPELAGDPDALVAAAVAGRRVEAWAVWQQLQSIAGLLRAWSVTDVPDATAGRARGARRVWRVWRPGQDVDPVVMVRECVVTEVAVAFGIGEQTAADRVTAAEALIVDGRLPVTARLLAEGRIDWLKAWTIVSRTRGLNPTAPTAPADSADSADAADADSADDSDDSGATVDLARLVDAQVAPAAPGLTVPALRAALDLSVARVDADAAAHAVARARRHRRVGITAGWEGPGTAQLWAIGPAEGRVKLSVYNGRRLVSGCSR